MSDQLIIANFDKGQTSNKTAFNIDNKAFPVLFNAYTWRGRVKRKRGTVFLGRLQIQAISVNPTTTNWQFGPIALVAGAVNLITALSLPVGSSITPGSISFVVGANTYTEPSPPDGTLVGVPGGTGTINYATGAVTISGGGVGPLTGTFDYYPGLPVMGLQDFVAPGVSSNYPLTLAFDTRKSYQVNQAVFPETFYNTTYYKVTGSPFSWSGQDYQLFWTTNYSSALWATNNVPGFNFVNATYSSGTGTTSIVFNFLSGGNPFTTLVIGDVVWFNEWTGGSTINGLSGTVSDVTLAAAGTYTITFTSAQTVSGSGIAQLLTASVPGEDGIKWYDGDPTSGTGLPADLTVGWVNFAPPLTETTVSINNLPPDLYYLVGALMIVDFKDRLLFFSPWIQTSTGAPIKLQDTVIWSWNGTPYYTDPVPVNETFDARAYYVDQTGLGGYLSAGISQPIATVMTNEDVLLVGFGGDGLKTRFVYTGNDLQPFLFFSINNELPSNSTFTSINLDKGGIDVGAYGITLTDQQSSQRIDLEIPDNIFQLRTLDNGVERVNAIRDFINEWIYFAYPYLNSKWKFPTQSFIFNYRDNTWGILYENFTRHGNYRSALKFTWATVPFDTWAEWNVPWNAGLTSALTPTIIAGTPQGYVLRKGFGTGESKSCYISAISNNGGFLQITSYNHCLTAENEYTGTGDFIYITNALGTTSINHVVAKVTQTPDADNFVTDLLFPVGTYLGLGEFSKLAQPIIQTKQFPFYWEQGRKTILSVQKYLFDATANSQLTININLSQDPYTAWNQGPIIPNSDPDPVNSGLVYSQTLFTCPEQYVQISDNQPLGLVGDNSTLTYIFDLQDELGYVGDIIPGTVFVQIGSVATFTDNGVGGFTTTGTGNSVGSSIDYLSGTLTLVFTVAPDAEDSFITFEYIVDNIQMPTATAQYQIWHRFGTSLIGDSVQLTFTLSEDQMKNYGFATDEIALHAIHLVVKPGPHLA